jgi:hypothetical protein
MASSWAFKDISIASSCSLGANFMQHLICLQSEVNDLALDSLNACVFTEIPSGG